MECVFKAQEVEGVMCMYGEDYLQSEVNDEGVMRSARKITEREYHPSKDANNYFIITCPFCGAKTRAQVRGYGSRGRRCSGCSAMFRSEWATRKIND